MRKKIENPLQTTVQLYKEDVAFLKANGISVSFVVRKIVDENQALIKEKGEKRPFFITLEKKKYHYRIRKHLADLLSEWVAKKKAQSSPGHSAPQS